MLLPQKNSTKVVFVDWGVYLHKAIFAGIKMERSPTWLAMTMIIGDLKKVGINPDDIIIIACDSHGKGNWRKDLDKEYKSKRKQKREDSGIDFETHFCLFENLLGEVEFGTPFHVIEVDRLEADDIISAGSRFYNDKEIVIISHDSDYEQLFIYPHVKIFSPTSKKYKIAPSNPKAILEKKIKKEVTDDLTSPVNTEEEYRIRKTIVDLSELPKDIEFAVTSRLKQIVPKENWDINKMSSPSIRGKMQEIYNADEKQQVDYIKCVTKKKKINKKVKQQSLI